MTKCSARVQGLAPKGGKRVHLTLRLSAVCCGCDRSSFAVGRAVTSEVRTVEEHGAALGLGVSGVSAFLPLSAYVAVFGPEARPVPGQLVNVVVKERLREGRSLVVDCDAAAVAAAKEMSGDAVTLRSLLPGTLVTVRTHFEPIFWAQQRMSY
jgi:rRNA biogenesis protein RRP5